MYLVNYHAHTYFSPDSEAKMYEIVSAAIAAGIKELCITDHCDLVDGYGKLSSNPLDIDLYLNNLMRMKMLFGDKIEVKYGIELGEAVSNPELAAKIAGRKEFDFVISAIHNLEGMRDYFFLRFKSEKECFERIEEYLAAMLETAKTTDFDVLAHITYPLRYMRARDGWNVDFRPYDELIYEILKAAIDRGKGIELNTSGFINNGGEPMPPRYILELYKDIGGEIITIGTDAHKPELINAGLQDGYALLSSVGFEFVATYTRREPEFIKL